MRIDAQRYMWIVGLFLVAAFAPQVWSQVGTAFSYQGAISDTGGPVNGTLDFRLSLWDSGTAGSQISGPLDQQAAVADGLFSLDLDFGADPFTQNIALWLQVEVSADGGNNYTALDRQRLTPAPYSLSTRGLLVMPDGSLGVGTNSPQARLDVRDSSIDGTALCVEQSGAGLLGFGVDATVAAGTAVRGHTTATSGTTFGVYGWADFDNASGWGVFSNGRIGATGTKSFVIDHPLDPANMMLVHYSSEAPEPLNTYSGTVILDEFGEATVALPEYFDRINTDVRYQLTAIGAAAPSLHVATEVLDNHFAIAGGGPGLKVSWQVTARRDDAFVRLRGVPTEVAKDAADRGRYLLPEAYDAPAEKAMHADRKRVDR